MVKVMVKTPPPPRTGRPRETGRCTSTRARATLLLCRSACLSGFWVSAFVFRFWIRVSGFGFWVSGFGCWLLAAALGRARSHIGLGSKAIEP